MTFFQVPLKKRLFPGPATHFWSPVLVLTFSRSGPPNYDGHGAASAYWNSARMSQLPLETRSVCQAFYTQEGSRMTTTRSENRGLTKQSSSADASETLGGGPKEDLADESVDSVYSVLIEGSTRGADD